MINKLYTKDNKGSALIAVFVLSALMSFLVVSTYLNASYLVELKADTLHSNQAKQEAIFDAVKSYFSDGNEQAPSILKCHRGNSESNVYPIQRSLCSISGTNSPFFNYNSIFSNPSDCATQEILPQETSSFGFILTPLSLFSSKLCNKVPARNPSSYVVLANLEISESFSIQSPAYTLAASGYLDINTTLRIRSDALIIAGGDLHMNTIIAENSPKITLISTTGKVVVDIIDGETKLQAHAKHEVYLPYGFIQTPHDLSPPILHNEVFGMYGGESF